MGNKLRFSDGYSVIFEAKKDPASVQLFEYNGTYYVMTEDVEDYMCASMNTEISDAIADIAKANGVDSQTICCVGSFDEDFLPEIDDEDEDSIPDEDEEDDILEPAEGVEEGFIGNAIKKQARKIAKRWEEAEKKEKAKRAAEEAEVKEFIKTHKSDVDDVKSQIKKIAPKVIADANKNKSYLKELNENIDAVDADMYNGKLVRKFVYTLLKEKEDYITISIVDKSVMDAVENVGNLTLGDDPVEVFNENMRHIIAFIEEDIEDEVDSDTVKLNVDYYSVEDVPVAGQFTFWFYPKTRLTKESVESLDEVYEMLLEKSVEDGAMTLKKAERCYNKILKTCKSEAETEKQLDECIKTLNKCIDNMKAEKKKVEDGLKSKDRVKYSLKALIPFNSIYRMIKRNDWNMEGVSGELAPLYSVIISIVADKVLLKK